MDSNFQFLRDELSQAVLQMPATVRRDYKFFVPFAQDSADKRANLALFSSPIPSMETAIYGFFSYDGARPSGEEIKHFAALGAKSISIRYDDKVFDVTYNTIEDFSTSREEVFNSDWVSRKLENLINLLDNPLNFDLTKSLIIQAAKNSLLERLRALYSLLTRNDHLSEEDSLKMSFEIINALMLGKNSSNVIVQNYANRIRNSTTFENIPPATLAEAYENFGISDFTRRSSGVVYTPAWLAKFAVSNIPSNVLYDKSICFEDPACGSGTFLVALIERLAQGLNSADFNQLSISRRIKGRDIDPLAVYITILSLNYISKQANLDCYDWDVETGDSTSQKMDCQWIIGNLPFGYRTHGAHDVSSVILDNILSSKNLAGFSLIMPESFTHNRHAATTRKNLISKFRISDLYLIPDKTFASGRERTILINAYKGNSDSFKLRFLSKKHISRYQTGTKPMKYVDMDMRVGESTILPISPFDQILHRIHGEKILSDDFIIFTGTQFYGKEEAISKSSAEKIPVLTEPANFWQYYSGGSRIFNYIPNEPKLFLMKGPWDLRSKPKLIIRSTVESKNRSRMAALLDLGYAAFNDKFIGIWDRKDDVDNLRLLGLYLQSDFVLCWMRSHNPNRKIRKFVLEKLPIPDFSLKHWAHIKNQIGNQNLFHSKEPDKSLISTKDSETQNTIETVYALAKLELGITDELAAVLSLIRDGEQTEKVIESVREIQLAENYREYSQKLTDFEKSFLDSSGDFVKGEML